MKLKTVWVVFKEPKSLIWNETPFRFQTVIDDLKEGDLLVVETKYGEALAKVVDYGECENPEMLKKVLCKVNI